MRRVAFLSVLFILASNAPCLGVYAQLQWDDCDDQGDFNRSFAGPAIYRQVISGGQFQSAVRGYTVRLHLQTANIYNVPTLVVPPAWRFDVPDGCQAERLTVSAPATSCPTLAVDNASFAVSYERHGTDLDIILVATFDPVQPDPGTVYTLFALDYDHSRSAAGPQDPSAACGEADLHVCFVITDAQWTDVDFQPHAIGFDPYHGRSWQDAPDSAGPPRLFRAIGQRSRFFTADFEDVVPLSGGRA